MAPMAAMANHVSGQANSLSRTPRSRMSRKCGLGVATNGDDGALGVVAQGVQLVVGHGGEHRVGRVHADVGSGGGRELGGGRVAFGVEDGAANALAVLLVAEQDELEEQLLLGVDVHVERTRSHPDGGGEVAHRHPVVAPLGEENERVLLHPAQRSVGLSPRREECVVAANQ